MEDTNKPCVLFIIPHAHERLDKYFYSIDKAGYDVCIVRYGSASKKEWRKKLDWVEAECHNLKAIIRPDDLCFCDAWARDEFKKSTYRISKLIAKLVKHGAVDVEAKFDWGGSFDDEVVMYGAPDVFVQRVIKSIEMGTQKP